MLGTRLVERDEGEADFTVHDGESVSCFRQGRGAVASMFVKGTVVSVDGTRGVAHIDGYGEPCEFICEVECGPGDRVLLDGDGESNYAWANVGRAVSREGDDADGD